MAKPPLYRFLEIVPGFLVWLTFSFVLIFSFLKPTWVIIFIIILSTLWLCRVIYLMVHVVLAWQKMSRNLKINWFQKLKKFPYWENFYHLIFLPTYKEPKKVVLSTFQSLTQINYYCHKLIVVLAGEERDRDNFLKISEEIKKRFEKKFFKLFITLHPQNLPDEIPGKGSNLHWAGHRIKKEIDQLKIPYENIIVSAFDIDTRPHPDYFAYLTFRYLNHPQPTHASFQPVAIYNNNIWQSPFFSRLVSRGTTFWLFSELSKNRKLFTFSSHSMSFKALVEIGFWQKDIISEDSRIALQCLIYYQGDYRVESLYLPVWMDTVYAGSFWRTIVNQYKQVLRWGWGVENFPYLAWHLLKKKTLFKKIFSYLWKQLEGSYSWATVPILLFVFSRWPLWVAKGKVETTVLGQNAPFILEWLLTIGTVGLVISAILSTKLLPPKPASYSSIRYLSMIFQWLIFPFSTIIFGSIPALEAITRLMINRPLSFRVTEKKFVEN